MDAKVLYHDLVNTTIATDLLDGLVGQVNLATTALPHDSTSSLLLCRRRFLLRCKLVLDSQRFGYMVQDKTHGSIDKDSILRLLIYLLNIFSRDDTPSSGSGTIIDQAMYLHLFLGVVLSCFRLIIQICKSLTTDEEELIRSKLDVAFDIWKSNDSLPIEEIVMLEDLLAQSLELDEEETSKDISLLAGFNKNDDTVFHKSLEQLIVADHERTSRLIKAVEKPASFWLAFDVLTVISMAVIALGGKIENVVHDRLVNLFQNDNECHHLQKFLSQLAYIDLCNLKFTSPVTISLYPQALARLRRFSKIEIVEFKQNVLERFASPQHADMSNEGPGPAAITAGLASPMPSVGQSQSTILTADNSTPLTAENDGRLQLAPSSERRKALEGVDAVAADDNFSRNRHYQEPLSASPVVESTVIRSLVSTPVELSVSKTHRRSRRSSPSAAEDQYIDSSHDSTPVIHAKNTTIAQQFLYSSNGQNAPAVAPSPSSATSSQRLQPAIPLIPSSPDRLVHATANTGRTSEYHHHPRPDDTTTSRQTGIYAPAIYQQHSIDAREMPQNRYMHPESHTKFDHIPFPEPRTNPLLAKSASMTTTNTAIYGQSPTARSEEMSTSLDQTRKHWTNTSLPSVLLPALSTSQVQGDDSPSSRTTYPSGLEPVVSTEHRISQSPPPPFSAIQATETDYTHNMRWHEEKERPYESGLEVVVEDARPVIDPDTISLMNHGVRAPSVASSRKSGLFSRFSRGAKSKKKDITSKAPNNLGFCFSACSSRILLWTRRDSSHIISIAYPFQSGTIYHLPSIHSITGQETEDAHINIHYVAASEFSTAVLVHNERLLRLYWLDVRYEHQHLDIDNHISTIQCISISPDGTSIALGCGMSLKVYRVLHNRLRLVDTLKLPVLEQSLDIRHQCINFSPDSKKLVVATQVTHAPQNNVVHITVWECSGSQVREEANLDPVRLTVGYSDDTGISGIFYGQEEGDRVPARVILTAGLIKPYTSILFLGTTHKNRHLDLSDKRIDAAAQCSNQSLSHNLLIKSGRHRIYLCDTRTGSVQPVADLTAERKNMKPKNEGMALGVMTDTLMFAIWKNGDNGLKLSTLTPGVKLDATLAIDLAELYNRFAGL